MGKGIEDFVALALTPGQGADDIAHAEPLLENIEPDAFLADKEHDADRLIDRLTERGVTLVISSKRNRATQRKT